MFRAGERQSSQLLKERFADVPPPLALDQARVEAARCLYCFDAPCTRACPTRIDVPRFIRQILHHDELSAAHTILEANIFGGSCARACPTEVLCEGACVDHILMKAPVQIGRLQRHACDTAADRGFEFFEPGPATGKRVAIVGSGPAGLSCAHALRRLGHAVTVFEARGLPGGLDTLGIAAYKISTEFALAEIEMIRRIGIPSNSGIRSPRRNYKHYWAHTTRSSWASAWAEPSRSRSRANSSRASGSRSISSFRPIRNRSPNALSGPMSS